MNTPLTLVKATGLSFVIFWGIILTEETFRLNTLPYIILSIIPVGICCTLTICLTVLPFYWSKNEGTTFKTVYNTYFPFYAIALFGICIYTHIRSNFQIFPVAFIAAAFFTLLKSWIWIISPIKTNLNETL